MNIALAMEDKAWVSNACGGDCTDAAGLGLRCHMEAPAWLRRMRLRYPDTDVSKPIMVSAGTSALMWIKDWAWSRAELPPFQLRGHGH